MIKKILLILLLLVPNVAYMADDVYDPSTYDTEEGADASTAVDQKEFDINWKTKEETATDATKTAASEEQGVATDWTLNPESNTTPEAPKPVLEPVVENTDISPPEPTKDVEKSAGDTTQKPATNTSDSTSSSDPKVVSDAKTKYESSQSAADSYQNAADNYQLPADDMKILEAQKKIVEDSKDPDSLNYGADTTALESEIERRETELAEWKANAQATADIMKDAAAKDKGEYDALKWVADEEKAEAKVAAEAKREKECGDSGDCIDKDTFTIKVNNISPWMDVDSGNSTKQNVNKALGTIIQTLMIALWSLALLIMTVGAGYIVLHSGQDELLSKWKSIFMSWVYGLLVALSAYYIVAIVRFILFQ